jgi:hypothetical protein
MRAWPKFDYAIWANVKRSTQNWPIELLLIFGIESTGEDGLGIRRIAQCNGLRWLTFVLQSSKFKPGGVQIGTD